MQGRKNEAVGEDARQTRSMESSCSAHVIFVRCIFLAILITWPSATVCTGQTAAPKVESADILAQAKARLEHGNYIDADKILRDHLADYPSDVEAKYLLAFALFRENKPADSLNEYTAAARSRTPTAADLKTVALDYVLLNDYADADHWIRHSLSMDAHDAEAWYEAGRIEYTLNYFLPALNAFQQSLRLNPALVKAEDNLGLTFEALNRVDDAISAYRRALAMQATSLHPSEQPLLNLATLLIERNQLDEAMPLLQQAAQIAPQDWRILAQFGKLYTGKGDLDSARGALEQAVALEPQRASLHFQLGQVYRKMGAPEKALAEFAATKKLMGTTSSSPD